MIPAHPHNKLHRMAMIYLLIATLIWGAAGPVIKLTLEYVQPFTFLFLRFLLATIIIIPFLLIEEQKHPVCKKDWVHLIIVSLLGGAVSLALVFWGLNFTTAIDAGLLSAVAPIVTLAASGILLGEKISKNEKVGSLIAIIGSLVIIIQPFLESGFTQNPAEKRDLMLRILGNVLVFSSILVSTMHAIWSKKVFDHSPSKLGVLLHYFHLNSPKASYSPFFLTAIMSIVSLIALAPFSFLEILKYGTPDLTSSITPIAGITYMAFFSTLVAYGMYEWAIKAIPVSETAVFSYLTPLFTLPFAYIMLGETASSWFLFGGAIIAVGVYISERHESTNKQSG